MALFFHEKQAREQTEVSNFIHATGRGLSVEAVSYRMPGAFVSDQLASLVTEVAVCFVYVSVDFLNDVNYMGSIRDFLKSCYSSSSVHLVPIYPNDDSIDHHEMLRTIRPILNRYNGLVWRSSFFWERLTLALPPRLRNEPLMDNQQLMERPRNQRLADLCLVAHENQLNLVRTIFERYSRSLSIVHFRHGQLFNCPQSERPESLLQVVLGGH